MTPQEFADEIVVPTIEEFKADPRSRRCAYLACIVTFHLNDHLKKAGEVQTERAMRGACGDAFDVVRAVCNGTKHVQTNASHPIPFAAGDDWDRPPAILGEMVLGVSTLGDTAGGREIGGSGPARRDIYSTVVDVLAAFCSLYPTRLGGTDLSKL